MASEAEVEAACRGMYGKHWDGPDDKRPGEAMREVWRNLARKALAAADEERGRQLNCRVIRQSVRASG